MDVKALFPTGEYSVDGRKYMVKTGVYFESVAEDTGNGLELTPVGKALLGKADEPAPTAAPKTRKAKVAVEEKTVDDLDL